MHRISNGTQVTSLPTPAAVTGTPGFATPGVVGSLAATVIDPDAFNSQQEELIAILLALGIVPSKTNNGQVLQSLQLGFSPVIGSTRNAKISVSSASASATFTADEIIVGTALAGQTFRLASFSQTINLATTGAGGMDTGSAPVSGYVAAYAIYNPTTQTASILATNATSAAAPTIYGGANMPSGYTASALIGVWPTNGSSQFPVFYQIDREVWYFVSIYSGAGNASFMSQSIAAGAPKNATKWKANWACGSTALGPVSLAICPTAGGQGTPGYTCGQLSASAASQAIGGTLEDMIILTPQTIYFANSGTASSFTLNSYGYWF